MLRTMAGVMPMHVAIATTAASAASVTTVTMETASTAPVRLTFDLRIHRVAYARGQRNQITQQNLKYGSET